MPLCDFFDRNRGKGSTVALVAACVEANGYLIVGNSEVRRYVLRNFPRLRPENVLTCSELEHKPSVGMTARPIFIDVTAMLVCFGQAFQVPQEDLPSEGPLDRSELASIFQDLREECLLY